METTESTEKDIINLRPQLICDVDKANRVLRIVYTGAPEEFMHALLNRSILEYDVHPYTKSFIDKLIQIECKAKEVKAEATVAESTATSKEYGTSPATEQSRTASQQLADNPLASGGGCLLLLLVGIGGAASAAYILLPRAVTALQTLL